MKPTGGSVAAFIADVTPERRRRDAETLTALLQEVSGREPELWGTIIGFGSCHYRYPTGTEGDMPVLAFAPRHPAAHARVDRIRRRRLRADHDHRLSQARRPAKLPRAVTRRDLGGEAGPDALMIFAEGHPGQERRSQIARAVDKQEAALPTEVAGRVG